MLSILRRTIEWHEVIGRRKCAAGLSHTTNANSEEPQQFYATMLTYVVN